MKYISQVIEPEEYIGEWKQTKGEMIFGRDEFWAESEIEMWI